MRNQRILFYTDNAALVDIINRTTSRDPTIMVLVRQLVLACLKFNIIFRAQHVPGAHNTLAVSLTGFEIQGTSPSGRTGFADRYSHSPYATQLVNITSTLIQSSLQPSSIPTYRRAWRLYTHFSNRVLNSSAISLPLSPSNLGLFISFMFDKNYACSTARTYVSALGYCHRLAGHSDPTKVFWVLEMLKGYTKMGMRVDTRLPITLPILLSIVDNMPSLCSTLYESRLYQAMCTTAFFAFLRAGEITICPLSQFVLQIEQLVKLEDQAGGILGLKITFRDFKHSYNKGDVSLTLSRRSDICPVQILLDYLSLRGFSNGPLFMTPNGTAVSRHSFTQILSLVFQRCGLATFAAENGFSDVQYELWAAGNRMLFENTFGYQV